MAPRSSSNPSIRPPTPPMSLGPTTPPRTPCTPVSGSPRNPENSHWVRESNRRSYLYHLRQWALNHDSSPHFNGTITPCWPAHPDAMFRLGQSVKCETTQTLYPGYLCWVNRKQIIVRLFPPRENGSRYRLVVRSGSGWMSSREFFEKEYFSFRRREGNSLRAFPRAEKVEPENDAVSIRPLFHLFLNLPVELQHKVLDIAVGKTDIYIPHRHGGFGFWSNQHTITPLPSPTKLQNLLLVSKALNQKLSPWVYSTTNFYFGTTGLTNFLWLAGPKNRALIKKMTLSFGPTTLAHCLRWFAPDPIFELCDPPVQIYPHALQYLWRCQIQDVTKELHLNILTIDVAGMETADLAFVARILHQSFGSVGRIRYTRGRQSIKPEDAKIEDLLRKYSWAQLCKDAFIRHRDDHTSWSCFSARRRGHGVKELEEEMRSQEDFFYKSGG